MILVWQSVCAQGFRVCGRSFGHKFHYNAQREKIAVWPKVFFQISLSRHQVGNWKWKSRTGNCGTEMQELHKKPPSHGVAPIHNRDKIGRYFGADPSCTGRQTTSTVVYITMNITPGHYILHTRFVENYGALAVRPKVGLRERSCRDRPVIR